MRIFFVRHGESEGNKQRKFIGKDGAYPLTELGEEQAINAVRILKNLDVGNSFSFYSSPTVRTIQTARIIGKELKKDAILDERLTEIDLGELEGKTEREVGDEYNSVIKEFSEKPSLCEIPGGESVANVQQRSLSFVYDRLDENSDLVLVTHDLVIRSFLVHAMNISLDFIWSLSPDELMMSTQSRFEYGDKDISLGSVSEVLYENGEFEVKSIGLT